MVLQIQNIVLFTVGFHTQISYTNENLTVSQPNSSLHIYTVPGTKMIPKIPV